jgi:hypothetical protein
MERFRASTSVPCLSRPAMIAPLSARIDPTDRSMPPVRITRVIPTDRHRLTEICRITVQKLSGERKPSARRLNARTISNRAISEWDLASSAP